MSSEIESLCVDLLRDAHGGLKGERLKQLHRIGVSMSGSLSEHDFTILKTEISKIRKAQMSRLEKWRRLFGGH